MKVIEAQDWQKIRDPALKWLGRFTYENVGKRVDETIWNSLVKRFPNEAGTLYRGLNFTSPERWQEFITHFKEGTATLTFDGVSSWTKDPDTATQFAITQPTYQLNLAVLQAHGTQTKNRESLSGYRGVIISTQAGDGIGVDVDKTTVGHESEVVLPAGQYTIKIHKVLKLYKHQLEDKETSIDEVILNTTKADLSSREREHSFFDYVIHHHGKELSPKSQAHLFNLFKPRAGEPLFKSSVQEYKNYFSKMPEVTFDYAIPSWKLFDLAQQGVFDDTQMMKIKKLARQILSQAIKPVTDNIVRANYFNSGMLKLLEKLSGDYRLTNSLKRVVGERVHEINSRVPEINKISDPKEKRQAIDNYTHELTSLLSKLV